MQQICRRSFIQFRDVPHVLLLRECEVRREHLNRSLHPVARHAAQFDEIVGAGNRDEQPAVIVQHPRELLRVQARGNGENGPEAAIGERQEAIGIGHDPAAGGIAPRCRIDRRGRDVDAVSLLRCDRAEVIALAASGIENGSVGRIEKREDRIEQRLREAAVEEAAPRGDCLRRVARHFRAPVLRLQQIEVAAARGVERMPAAAERAA